MPTLLSFIPKQWLIVIGVFFLGSFMITTSYNKGVESERNKWKLNVEQQVNKEVNTRLLEVNQELTKALQFKQDKDNIIKKQSEVLEASEQRYKALQERLRDVLSNPTTECISLPDDEYRLYESYLNQTPN